MYRCVCKLKYWIIQEYWSNYNINLTFNNFYLLYDNTTVCIPVTSDMTNIFYGFPFKYPETYRRYFSCNLEQYVSVHIREYYACYSPWSISRILLTISAVLEAGRSYWRAEMLQREIKFLTNSITSQRVRRCRKFAARKGRMLRVCTPLFAPSPPPKREKPQEKNQEKKRRLKPNENEQFTTSAEAHRQTIPSIVN